MFPKALRLEVIGLLCLKALALTAIYLSVHRPACGTRAGRPRHPGASFFLEG
jgi:hypothetical protein